MKNIYKSYSLFIKFTIEKINKHTTLILRNAFLNNNICIIGMDGTGKTTTVNKLQEILGYRFKVQYMGFRDHVTWIGKKRFHQNYKRKGTISSKFLNLTVAYIEMWFRVIPHWSKDDIIIYDRYAWGVYDNSEGFTKLVGKIFFKYLFPKPKYVFYLYCPMDESIKRKDDITDVVEFKNMKKNFDKAYLDSPSVFVINTFENNVEETVHIIIQNLPKNYLQKYGDPLIS